MLQLWCDGLCCPRRCQKLPYLLGSLSSAAELQALNFAHVFFNSIPFFSCKNTPCNKAYIFKRKSGTKLVHLSVLYCCKAGVKAGLCQASSLNTILQVHFIVALLNGYIKIKNEESTIEAAAELSGSSGSGSSRVLTSQCFLISKVRMFLQLSFHFFFSQQLQLVCVSRNCFHKFVWCCSFTISGIPHLLDVLYCNDTFILLPIVLSISLEEL